MGLSRPTTLYQIPAVKVNTGIFPVENRVREVTMNPKTTMSGIIRTVKNKDNPYTTMRRATFEDEHLSWAARGILAYLLCKPDNWELRVTDLIRNGDLGERGIRSVLAELQKLGYLVRSRLHLPNGTFQWISTVYEEPPPSCSKSSMVETTILRLTMHGSTTDGPTTDGQAQDIMNTNLPNTKLPNTNLDNSNNSSRKRKRPAAAAAVVDLDLKTALRKLKIGEPVLTELAASGTFSPEVVQAWIEHRARNKHLGPGFYVDRLRAGDEPPPANDTQDDSPDRYITGKYAEFIKY
ncbi:MAG: hypothetical protein A2Z04_06715 [Chloroflexi bacterium RBG_16_57_9]|nr:MAG: hypothetical protein A2Z04_06715 [Chloroflexi bacterium RBG_16_57_9]